MPVDVKPNTIVVFADIACPWAHVAIHRLHEARRDSEAEEAISFDIRAFPLELLNKKPTSRRGLDAEIPVAGALAPGAGWSVWHRDPSAYPVTMIPPMEAVYAAKEQSLGISDRLDRALRAAFFAEARCVTLHHEILKIAGTVDGLDAERLEDDLIGGRHKRRIFEDKELADRSEVLGSPHLFFPDGTDAHNPGIEFHWEGDKRGGFPVVDEDDPEIYDELIGRAR